MKSVTASVLLVVSAVATSAFGAEPAYANTYHPLKSPIGPWNELTTWYNDTTKSAATQLPGADDRVNLNQNNRSILADGCAVEYSRMDVANGTGVSAGFYQTGGSLKGGYWTFVGAGGGVGTMCLTNVDAVLSGYRLSVGNQAQNSTAGDCLFQMRGGSLLTDYTDGLLTSTWGRNTGTSTLDFDGTVWSNLSAAVKIGFGSVNTNRFLFKNGTFMNEKGFLLGANVQNWGAASACGYEEAIVENSVWTNKDEVTLGSSLQHKTRLVISNTVFAALKNVSNKQGFQMGGTSYSVDTLEIISCPQFYTAKSLSVGAGSNSTSRIVVKGQKGGLPSASEILEGFSFDKGSDRTIEIEVVDSDYVPSSVFTVLSNAGQTRRWTFRDCDALAFDEGITVGRTAGCAELTFVSSHVSTEKSVTGANAGEATNVTVRLVNSTLEVAGTTYLANNGATGCGRFVVDGSSGLLKTSGLHVPRQGYGELVITNGGNVEAGQMFGPNMTGCEGRYFIDGSLTVSEKMAACNQPGSTGEIVQVSGTFDCSTATSMTFGNANSRLRYLMKGGEFKGNPGYATYFATASGADCLLDLQGGTFGTKCFIQPDQDASFRLLLNGGTLKALAAVGGSLAFIPSGVAASVGDGGAIIDLNGFSGVCVNAGFAHASDASDKDGGLRIRGTGSVVFSGTSTFTGDVIVEEGTLDMSTATFSLGPDAVLGGSGALKAPAAGLTVNGTFALDPTAFAGSLTVVGNVTLGSSAKVAIAHPESLVKGVKYRFFQATALTGGVPAAEGLPDGWKVRVANNALEVVEEKGLVLLVR